MLLVVSQCNFLNLTPAKRYPAAAGGIEMRVVSPKDDQELVRRLVTGLVACWEAIPEGVRADILREATLAFDPASKRVGLDHQLKHLVEQLQKELA